MNCVTCKHNTHGPSKGQDGHDAYIARLRQAGWFVWADASRIAWHGVALCPTCAATPVGKVLATVHEYDQASWSRS